MIRLQEGRDTDVITGLCLYRADRDEWIGAVEVSVVRFGRLTDAERIAYLDSGRWEGKSGGYGVQDRDPFVSVVRGSFSNVVGLPMERLADAARADHCGLNDDPALRYHSRRSPRGRLRMERRRDPAATASA